MREVGVQVPYQSSCDEKYRRLLREIDQEARRLGVTRQAFIKIRLADSLQQP